MAEGKGDVRRIGGGRLGVVLVALHPLIQETRAPLPAPLVSDIRIKADRADVFVELVTTGRNAIGVGEITVVAVKHLRAPGETLELIVLERDVTQLHVKTRELAFFFSQRADAVGLHKNTAQVSSGIGI